MKVLNKYIGYMRIVSFLLVSSFLGSCDFKENLEIDSLLTKFDSAVSQKKQVECLVTKVETSDDYKFMNLSVKLNKGTGVVDISDTTAVQVNLHQKAGLITGIMVNDERPPIFYAIHHIAKDSVAASKIKMLMLVDLSLPQYLIDLEQEAVLQARTLLGSQHLYVAFMQDGNVSETYEATDYIINTYFKNQSSSNIFLYRSLLTKLEEIVDSTSLLSNAKHKGLIVLSGGRTYENDRPIDPRHFVIQQRLAELAPQLQKRDITVSYAQFSPSSEASSKKADASSKQVSTNNQQELGIMRLICSQTDGVFQNTFDWIGIRDDFMKDHQISYDDYLITLMMPENKVFHGNHMSLDLDFINKQNEEKLTTCHLDYSFGSVFYPIIVGGKNLIEILLRGLLVALCLALAIWLALQLVVPWVRYQLFLRRYVIRYTGKQMSKDGILLSETCYSCKAPFEEGDEIVTKCSHTMHKECWDEIGYQCPEHGRNCAHGSHYYNSNNLLDTRNATFYQQWILAGLLAGLLAWVFFMLRIHLFSTQLLTNLMFFIFGIKAGTPEAERFLLDHSVHLDFQPSFGFCIAFFTTLLLSMLSLRSVNWKSRLSNILVRAGIAGLLSYLLFAFSCVIAILLGIKTNSMILDCLPWILMTAIIMYCVTWHTRVRIRPLWLVTACLAGVISFYMWMLLYRDTFVDFRLFLLLSFLFTTIIIAICIAYEAPHSEHYFLQASGVIKPVEIALYKWLRTDPSAVVTLGQSPDNSIQLSWDLSGNVAPTHAEIRLRNNSIWLTALEQGVIIDDTLLAAGTSEPLWHGRSFTIGNTTFTYIEKDL
jgi:hypothetical protein